MNNKYVIQSLAILFVISLIFTLFQIKKNFEQKKQIEKTNVVLVQNADSLEKVNNRLKILSSQLAMYQDSLTALVVSMNVGDEAETKKANNLVRKAENSKVIVTIYSVNPNSSVKQNIVSTLHSNGYGVDIGYDYSEKPSWMSYSSTVHYYSSKSKQRASEIASQLKNSTGVGFKINRGKGLGVIKGEEQWTIFVHYIN